MNCTEFEAAALLAIETREPLALATLEHALTCADCRTFWELQQQLDEVIVAWQFAKPPVGLTDAVLVGLSRPALEGDQETFGDPEYLDDPLSSEVAFKSRIIGTQRNSASRGKPRSSRMVIVSVAVCLVVAVVFATRFSRPDGTQRGRDFALTTPVRTNEPAVSNSVAIDSPPDVSSTLSAVFSDLRSEYREMASETTSMAQEMVNAIPHRAPVTVLPNSEGIELHPNSSDMDRIWRPIENGVESAFGFLWKAVPSEVPSG